MEDEVYVVTYVYFVIIIWDKCKNSKHLMRVLWGHIRKRRAIRTNFVWNGEETQELPRFLYDPRKKKGKA